jgi:hypothetical protein
MIFRTLEIKNMRLSFSKRFAKPKFPPANTDRIYTYMHVHAIRFILLRKGLPKIFVYTALDLSLNIRRDINVLKISEKIDQNGLLNFINFSCKYRSHIHTYNEADAMQLTS